MRLGWSSVSFVAGVFLLEMTMSWRKGGEKSIVFDGEEALGVHLARSPVASQGGMSTLSKGKELIT